MCEDVTNSRTGAGPRPSAARALAFAVAAALVLVLVLPATARADDCAECHGAMLRRPTVHPAMQKAACTSCHAPTRRVGLCKSSSASSWALAKPERELCAGCHDPKVPAARYAVKHDLTARCSDCHDAHATELPRLLRATGRKLCLGCHDESSASSLATARVDLRRKFVHAAIEKSDCQACHETGHGGENPKLLKKPQAELCYGCHKRKDEAKVVHTPVRAGECLDCHEAHSSSYPALARRPREQLCTACHETDSVLERRVRHAPVVQGRCLDCHYPHGGERPNSLVATGNELCLRCHGPDAKARDGLTPARKRVQTDRASVHKPVKEGQCTDCHTPAHSSDHGKLLKQGPRDLCYKCHKRKDDQRFTHGAVLLGDCNGCHQPHASDFPRLATAASPKETCFGCHQDDVTGRAVVHKPVAEGKCTECHGPHGAPNRWALVKGDGKQACYACHKPVDGGKVKHAVLEQEGCTGCHDPHAAGNRFLLGKKVNALCGSCHEQKDGQHAMTLGMFGERKGHVVSGLLDPRKPDREFSCASCHNPHGSDSPKLFHVGESSMTMCDGCHGDKTGKNPALTNIIHRARPQTQGSAGGGSGGGAGGDAAPGPALVDPAPEAPGDAARPDAPALPPPTPPLQGPR